MPRPIHMPPHPRRWNELTWPHEYPLAMNEMSFLLPHFLKEGRGKLDVYFTRVYNPVWTNPDGFSWIEVLTDESKVGLHVALTPTWSETAYFADYVLPMGLGSERHDLHSYETHDAQWIGFRQPVLQAARERLGETIADTREVNPGEVWEENEFWIELSWRIDPDGALGIRQLLRVEARAGREAGASTSTTATSSSTRCPGLPEKAAAEGLTPLEYMRRYGAFEVARGVGAQSRGEGPRGGARGRQPDAAGPRLHARARSPPRTTSSRCRRPIPTRPGAGRSASTSTARCCAASRRRAAGSSSTRRRSRTGAGPSTRCPPTSAATSTRRASRTARCRSSPPSACPCRSTRAARTRSGSTRSRTRTRSGSTRATPRRSASRPATSCASRRASATSSSRRG